MKSSLLIASFILVLSASVLPARAQTAGADSGLARTLEVSGQVPVDSVGDYVHAGSYRIWVETHLGRPDHRLADGTWLYPNRAVDDSAVSGTLAISFQNGRVTSMRLLSPAMTLAVLRRVPAPAALLAKR